jgi:hypothetical protein
LRRGSTLDHSTFIGAQAEITIDTTQNTVVVHDGLTQGGFPLSKTGHKHVVADILGAGNLLTLNAGVSPNNIVQLDSQGKLPPIDGSQLTHMNFALASHQHSVVDVIGLGNSSILDAGLLAGNVVQLDANAKLPAIDASQLVNLTLPSHMHLHTQITGLGTAAIKNFGDQPGNLVEIDSMGRLPALNANLLINVPVTPHGHSASEITGLGRSAFLEAGNGPLELVQITIDGKLPIIDGSNVTGVIPAAHTHTISNVTGLGSAASLNYGVNANNLVQLDNNAKLPPIDGGQLLNIKPEILFNNLGANAITTAISGGWIFGTSNTLTNARFELSTSKNELTFTPTFNPTNNFIYRFNTDNGFGIPLDNSSVGFGGIVLGNTDVISGGKAQINTTIGYDLVLSSSDPFPNEPIVGEQSASITLSASGNISIQTGGTVIPTGLGSLSYNGSEIAVVEKTMVVDNINKVAKLPQNDTDPVGVMGDIYYNTTSNTVKIFNGTSWMTLMMS